MERLGDKASQSARCARRESHSCPGRTARPRSTRSASPPPRSGSRCCSRPRPEGAERGCASSRSPTRSRTPTAPRRPRPMPRSGMDRCTSRRSSSPARHVEMQVLCDAQGSVLTLGERECSIQRRHQKLIEESPSPALAPDTREEIEDSVARACAAVGYTGAGTFEFLLGPEGEPYFIEVNCRLQVEHPVSELVTGIDIVREQVRIAAGERLAIERACTPARARDRDPDQRRGSRARLRARSRDRRPVPPAARARRPRRHRHRGRAARSRRTTTR